MVRIGRSPSPGNAGGRRLKALPRDAAAPAGPELHLELAEKLAGLPRDLALALLSLGAVGLVIPGPVPLGSSFVVLGTVVLWPSLLARTGGPLARRCPRIFRVLIGFADDLRTDLERRYPGSFRGDIPARPAGRRGPDHPLRPGDRSSSGRDA